MADFNSADQKVKQAEQTLKENQESLSQSVKDAEQYDFDELKIYFGDPYDIILDDGKIIRIKQPSIGDMLEVGEKRIYSTVSYFTCNTTSYRVQLWDMGIDWNKISDFEYVCKRIKQRGYRFDFWGI